MRTGRCESFAEASERMGERRAQLSALAAGARDRARRDRHAPVEPLAGPADHRHAALPPERRAAPLRRLAEQHLRAPRPRRHPRRRPRGRRAGRPPRLPAAPAGAVRQLAARRGREQRPPLGAHGDLHAHVPALRRARRVRDAGPSSRRTCACSTRPGSIDEHTQIWWSVRPHLAYPTVEIRICDAQPDLGEARALAGVLLRARRADRPRGRRGRAAAGAAAADDRGELLARDPLRALRHRCSIPGRTRCARPAPSSSGSASGSRPVADELGVAAGDPGDERGRAPDRPDRGGLDARGDLRRAGPCRRGRPWLKSGEQPSRRRRSCSSSSRPSSRS